MIAQSFADSNVLFSVHYSIPRNFIAARLSAVFGKKRKPVINSSTDSSSSLEIDRLLFKSTGVLFLFNVELPHHINFLRVIEQRPVRKHHNSRGGWF